jgi:uncharacterized protein
MGGFNLVVDACSASVHLVDELAYDVIGLYESNTKDEILSAMLEKYAGVPGINEAEIREVIGDVEALKGEGKLFSADLCREAGAVPLQNDRNQVIKALCLHVSHACNLTCDYCFASQGNFHGERALMSSEIGRQAIDFLLEHSGTRNHLEVDFFGGEPLLNWDMVKQTVAYARGKEKKSGKRFRFTLTTNGVLLDEEVMEFANREMYNVVLSLDGRKEIHDRLRRTVSGKGSYDLIVPKFQEFVRRRVTANTMWGPSPTTHTISPTIISIWPTGLFKTFHGARCLRARRSIRAYGEDLPAFQTV